MSSKKYTDKVCAIVIVATIIITVLFMNGENLGLKITNSKNFEYENHIFSEDKVHTINIIMDDFDAFIENCENEEYEVCDVVIDGETFKSVGIRAKGNTSLTQVKNYGNNRYSFKIEFDKYDDTNLYYGLDKLSLNNIIHDNTYLKDYLTYKMMAKTGVISPLCSFTEILINGEQFGLYLAVEGVEESFLKRNYGEEYGELYKPDSMNFGAGVGNGKKFDIEEFDFSQENFPENNEDIQPENSNNFNQDKQFDNNFSPPDRTVNEDDFDNADFEKNNFSGNKFGNMDSKSSSDVSLIYTDDNFDSYSNIFNNAKTDITSADKERLISSLKLMNNNESIETVVDVEAVIRYFAVHNFVCNFDSYTGSMIHNYYLYEKDGLLSLLPWDYNLAFGGFVGGGDATTLVNYPIDTPISGGTLDSRPMLSWIFENEEYTALYHEFLTDFVNDYFKSGEFQVEIEKVKQLIKPFVESDPTKFCTYEEFEKGVESLKSFCLLRAESILGQISGIIPSTSEEQEENKDNFIDAKNITISDMGSMENMGGKGDLSKFNIDKLPTQNGGFTEFPDTSDYETENKKGNNIEIPNFENGERPEIPKGNFGGAPPDFNKK